MLKTFSEVLICMSVINHVALGENLACAVFEQQGKQLWSNLVGLFSLKMTAIKPSPLFSFHFFTLHEYPVSLKLIQFSSLIAGINKETANKLIGLA